jgi:ribosomal protein L37E
MRTCTFCGYPRADGIQTHAWDCEWCTLLQEVKTLRGALTEILHFVTGNHDGVILKDRRCPDGRHSFSQRLGYGPCWCGEPAAKVELENQHGSSKEPTQRSTESECGFLGCADRALGIEHSHGYAPCPDYSSGAHPDASAAEPASAQADSAEPGGAEPERAG